MDIFLAICLGLGMGIIGAAAVASTGKAAVFRSPFGLLGLLAGVVVAGLVGAIRDDPFVWVLLGGLVAAFITINALGGLVAQASVRAGAGVALWIAVFEAIVAVSTILLAPLSLLPTVGLAYLAVERRRREGRKYKGLRSLS